MYDVSTGAAYAVLYIVLSMFTALAIISAGYCGKGGLLQKLGCILLPKTPTDEDGEEDAADTADFFLAARNSASAK